MIFQSFCGGNLDGLLDALIVCFKIHEASKDCAVTSMTFVGTGKGIVENDLSFIGNSSKNADGSAGDTNHTSCMRAGRANHDRAYHVKNTAFFGHWGRNLCCKRNISAKGFTGKQIYSFGMIFTASE